MMRCQVLPLLVLPRLQESLGNGALKAREECSQMGGEGNSPGSVRRPPPEEPPRHNVMPLML